MYEIMNNTSEKQKHITFIIMIFVASGVVLGGYSSYKMSREIVENTIKLESQILELQDKNIILIENLKKEQERNGDFQNQIGQITGTVDNLTKLAKTDKELLQKYSKIYFLNENYMPKGLVDVPQEYIYEKNKNIKILASTSQFLIQMMDDAKKDGVDLFLISGFRSFSEQGVLKDGYKMVYGSGANKFSADQGYSEHQLGTAVDFTSKKLGLNFVNFGSTSEYDWLLANAHKYGFILSYPKNNSYYQYEPWHWRFVGKKLAQRLYEEKQSFYDLAQRQIDPYLINLFDE